MTERSEFLRAVGVRSSAQIKRGWGLVLGSTKQLNERDLVIAAAKSLHEGYENEYYVRGPDVVRGVMIYTVPFKYQNGKDYGEVFVLKRRKTFKAYHTIREVMAAFGENDVIWRDRNLIALYVMCFIACVLLAAILLLCLKFPYNETIEKLISLFTLAIGYVVGNQMTAIGRSKGEAE